MIRKTRGRLKVLDAAYAEEFRLKKLYGEKLWAGHSKLVAVARKKPVDNTLWYREISHLASTQLVNGELHKECFCESCSFEKAELTNFYETFGKWRTTKGIYQFDQTVVEELWYSDFDSDVPRILLNLPEHGIMVSFDSPVLLKGDILVSGFIASLSKWVDGTYILDIALFEALTGRFIAASGTDVFNAKGAKELVRGAGSSFFEGHPESFLANSRSVAVVSGVINILLYLCSEKPDINHPLPSLPPRVHSGKHHAKLPSQEQVYEVGYRIGARIRSVRAKQDADWESSGCVGTTRVTHIRRAHWHTYWTGSRKIGEMKPILKWLNPILVGDDDLVPALHI